LGPNINQAGPMSSRSIYLRYQAAKCRAHAASLGDAETQAALLKLAEYIVQAEQVESATIDGGTSALRGRRRPDVPAVII